MHRVTKVVVWRLGSIALLATVAVVVVSMFGCASKKAAMGPSGAAPPPMPGSAPGMRMAEQSADYEYAGEEVADAARSAALPSVLITEAAAATVDRQIIRNANLTVKTEDAETARQKIVKMTEEAGGFLADSTMRVGEAGQRYVDIKVRVPATHFDEVLSAIRELGKVEHESIDTQDVTEEFLDLEARLRTLRQAEERLIAMLKRSGKLADLLEIERELATRREQIEKSQGRLRYLKDRVSFSTIQVSLYEKGPAVVGPSGPYDILYHVRSAYRVLVSMLQGILTALIYIVVDGVVIWLPVLLLIWLIVRRRRKEQA